MLLFNHLTFNYSRKRDRTMFNSLKYKKKAPFIRHLSNKKIHLFFILQESFIYSRAYFKNLKSITKNCTK